MKFYYFVKDWREGRDPYKVHEIESNTIEEAAKRALGQQYPGCNEDRKIEDGGKAIWCGPIKVPRDQEEYRLKKKFGDYHSYFKLKTDFDPTKRCYCCVENSTRRITVNIWGGIYEYDMCDEHAEEYDGVWGDGPMKYEPNKPTV